MMHNSKVIQYLNKSEVSSLKDELVQLESLNWVKHFDGLYLEVGALRDGDTFWIYKLDDDLNCVVDNRNVCSSSMNIIKSLYKNLKQGRTYWHTVKPGEQIYEHNDSQLPISDKVYKRYQVYLDVPNGAEITIDNRIWDNKHLTNCVLDFNMYINHKYINRSDKNLTFMVFDILK